MKKIITITLNPAFDLHYGMDKFEAKKENYVRSLSCDAGGKGINISRALLVNGIDNVAYVILGRDNGDRFERLLKADGVKYVPLYTDGSIRENITIHPENDKETRISLDNFSISDKELDELCEMLLKEIDNDTLISFSGRVPKGVEKSSVLAFLKKLSSTGAKIAIDSNSFTFDDLITVCPWFIKPNEQEISTLLGRPISTHDDAISVARELVAMGVAEEVMISLGALGAVFASKDSAFTVLVPDIRPLSTIGAGDSTVAGYIAATAEGRSLADSLRLSAAYGNAACLTEGTRPPMPESVASLYQQISVK